MQNFRIVSFADQNFTPHSVRVFSPAPNSNVMMEGDLFTLGDMVTNDLGMRGNIKKFSLSDDLQELFVYTTWSGVGMSIDQVQKVVMLPSKHQVRDQVFLSLSQTDVQLNGRGYNKVVLIRAKANVLAVHFHNKKEKYDLEVPLSTGTTRIYNVDADCVVSIKE